MLLIMFEAALYKAIERSPSKDLEQQNPELTLGLPMSVL